MSTRIPAWVNGQMQPVEKLEAHIRGLKHLAVSVFLLHQDQVLIQRRAMGKYHTPGLWANTCCTHPDWGETSADCAVRRLWEELGIAGVTPKFRQKIEYRADVGGGLIEHELVDIFVADVDLDLAMDPNPEEVMEARWVPVKSLEAAIAVEPHLFTPWLKIYMAEHASAIFGAERLQVM